MADLDQIIFVREPEAAAIYTARHLKNEMRVEIFEVMYNEIATLFKLMNSDRTEGVSFFAMPEGGQ